MRKWRALVSGIGRRGRLFTIFIFSNLDSRHFILFSFFFCSQLVFETPRLFQFLFLLFFFYLVNKVILNEFSNSPTYSKLQIYSKCNLTTLIKFEGLFQRIFFYTKLPFYSKQSSLHFFYTN